MDYCLQISLNGSFLSQTNGAQMGIEIYGNDSDSPLKTEEEQAQEIIPPQWDCEWHRRSVEFYTGCATQIGIRIRCKSAECFVDDLVLCKTSYATTVPQEQDQKNRPELMSATQAQMIKQGQAFFSCGQQNNLIADGDFENETSESWNWITKCDPFSIVSDENDNYNKVLQYQSDAPEYYYHAKYISISPNTDYTMFYRIRSLKKGEAGLALVSSVQDRKPIGIKIFSTEDECFDYEFISFHSNSENQIGLAILDAGGFFQLDNIGLCKTSDLISRQNLVQNGDAENSENGSWQCYGKETTDIKAMECNDNASSQTEAAKTHFSRAVGGNKFFSVQKETNCSQTICVQSHKTYELSFNYYSLNGGTSVLIFDNNGVLFQSVADTAGKWYHFDALFLTGNLETVTLKLYSGYNTFCFDNVSVTRNANSTSIKQFVSDCGFENQLVPTGATNGWSISNGVSMSQQYYKTGTQCLTFSSDWGNTWQTVNVSPQTTYYLRFFAQTAGNGQMAVAKVQNVINQQSLSECSVSSIKGKWKECSMIFNTGSNTQVNVYLTGNLNVCVDDLTFEEVKSLNGIVNGKFSAGPTGWTTTGATFYSEPGVEASAELWWGKSLSQTMKLEPQMPYHLSFEDQSAVGYNGTLNLKILSKGQIIAEQDFKDDKRVNHGITFVTDSDEDIQLVLTANAGNYQIFSITLEKAFVISQISLLNSITFDDQNRMCGGIYFENQIIFSDDVSIYKDNIEYRLCRSGMLFSSQKNSSNCLLLLEHLSDSVILGGDTQNCFIINSQKVYDFYGRLESIYSFSFNVQVAVRPYISVIDSLGHELLIYGEQKTVSPYQIVENSDLENFDHYVREWVNNS